MTGQYSFDFSWGHMGPPAKSPPLTIDDCRRILHAAQVMQLNPKYAGLRDHLAGVERWMRRMIKERCLAEAMKTLG